MNQLIVIGDEARLKSVLKRLTMGFVFADIPAEVKSTLAGIKSGEKLIKSSVFQIKEFVKSDTKCADFLNTLNDVKMTSKKSASACKAFRNQLQFDYSLMTTSERKTYIAKVAMYLFSFGAGAYVGNTLPDKDISILGIGSHRNFVFHSVVSAFAGRLALRFLERFSDCMNEEGLLSESDAATIKYCLTAARGGVAAGVALHLAIDGTIQGSKAVLFSDVGTLVGSTLVDDRAWLLVNSFMSFFIMGEEAQSEAKAKI